jgi:hypothetical protein
MPSAFVPPWIIPVDALAAARAGSAAGDAQAQLGLSREQLAQSAEQHAAELALQRDDMMARTQEQGRALQARQQQQSAADALRQQSINQQGLLGQGRIGVEEQGVDQRANAASAADQLRQQQIDNQAKGLQDKIDSSKTRQDDFSLQKYKGLQDQYQKTQQAYNTALTSDSSPDQIKALGSQLGSLKSQMTAIESSFAPPPPAAPPAATSLQPQVQPQGTVATPMGGAPKATPAGAGTALQPPPVNGQAGLPDFTGKPVGAGKPAPKTFTDKSGQKFIYTGSATDPSTDQNPSNWQVQ